MKAFRSIVALFLVLVIQLFQVQSAVAASSAPTCAKESNSCCCSGKTVCPCAKSAPEKETKAPLSPASSEAKAPEFIEPASALPSRLFAAAPSSVAMDAPSSVRLPIGYHGVSLSVAFCRFVI